MGLSIQTLADVEAESVAASGLLRARAPLDAVFLLLHLPRSNGLEPEEKDFDELLDGISVGIEWKSKCLRHSRHHKTCKTYCQSIP
jgi:hypothetical protein